MSLPLVSIVIPLYNEEETIGPLFERLRNLAAREHGRWEFVLVNDGSRDGTRQRLLEELRTVERWKLLQLSRNFGQQAAYRAGLAAAQGDAVVFLDADLQDPPELIPEMLAQWREGAKLVTACRRSRAERGLRRMLFDLFHAVFHRVTGGVMPRDSGTFGLMDRVVADHLRAMPELHVFLPALRSWVGYRQAVVWYDRGGREGAPKQTFRKLCSYAWNGIASFSTIPLKAISLAGLIISLLGFSYAAGLLLVRLLQLLGFFPALVVQGFTTLAVAVFCLGGIQLISLGIIGEYLAKVYQEVKRRPPFIVEEMLVSPADEP